MPGKNNITYIMPAGTIGATAYYVLCGGLGVAADAFGNIAGFLDNVKGKATGAEFCGLPVITPEKADIDAKVIVASFSYGSKLTQQLEGLGFTDIIAADSFLTSENTSSALEQMHKEKIEKRYNLASIESSLKSYFIDVGNSEATLILPKVELVVTQRCTLKCRDCCALMQYYTNPVHLDMDTVLDSVDRLFERVDLIRIVNIIGGEPLLAKGLPRLLKKLAEYRNRIGELTMITNGTLLADDDIIAAMKQAGLIVLISDYGILSRKKDELISKLRSAGLRCEVRPNLYWIASQSFIDGESDPEKTFYDCDAFCAQVMNGRLYYCNFAAHGDALRGFPFSEANYIDLNSPEATKESVRAYIKRTHALPACGYCTGRNMSRNPIPVAIQTKSPLPYRRY